MKCPLFSIVVPVFNPPLDALEAMIASVRGQTYQDWELLLVDDCSTDDGVRDTLRAAAGEDSRIVVVERESNGHIVAATNDGVDRATGQFIVFVDHDDTLVSTALARVAEAIADDPEADYIYTDEDKLGPDGRYYDRCRKPVWSPERLRGHMYTGHLSVMRADVVRAVGALREEYRGSQDHDLALRVTEVARSIVHVPEVLYHWRVVPGSAAGQVGAKPYAWTAGVAAVSSHLERVGVAARADYGRFGSTYRVVRDPLPSDLLVSVVLVVSGRSEVRDGIRVVLAAEAIRSVIGWSEHPHVELVVVHDSLTPQSVIDAIDAATSVPIVKVRTTPRSGLSTAYNRGALASSGQALVFLRETVEAAVPGLLDAIVAPLTEDGVAATGPRLSFRAGGIKSAGLRLDVAGVAHAFRGWSDEDPGPFAALCANREVSGVSGECLAVTRAAFEAVGGFSEHLSGALADADFGAKLRQRGGRVLWLADARVRSDWLAEGELPADAGEREFFERRWRPRTDPYLPE